LFKSIVSYGAIVAPYHAAMNLRDLEYVVAVADHEHFGRAAAACNVSQPTLSGQILKLETELGLRLFEREGRGARVSDRAAAVIAQARATLAAAAAVTDAARAARDPFAGPLRLGIIATVAPYLLPIALSGAIDALPQTPLHLVEDLTDRLLAGVHGGALDGAVIATDPEDDKLAEIALYDEPFFLVSARRPDRRRRASIRVEEIDSSTLLLLAEGHCLRDQALALCGADAQKSALRADVRATSLETLRHLVSAGQGATLAPLLAYSDWRRLGAGLDGSKIVGGGASRQVRLVFRRGSPRRAALEALARSLRDSAAPAVAASLRNWREDG
jgi:LysR family transcriptional regulator, hydrogen peroxide-inducible genes activator